MKRIKGSAPQLSSGLRHSTVTANLVTTHAWREPRIRLNYISHSYSSCQLCIPRPKALNSDMSVQCPIASMARTGLELLFPDIYPSCILATSLLVEWVFSQLPFLVFTAEDILIPYVILEKSCFSLK